jgi:ABC-type sugar transport system ATPase subunit
MIAVERIHLRQGAYRLDAFSMEIPAGAYGVLMGPTGCGKTSVIEAICGLRSISAGRILVGGRDVTRLCPGDRGVGYVPQDGALFPTMDVGSHLAFAPRLRGWSAADIQARVSELAGRLGITHLLGRRIQGLSGGERQRVALGRALAARPAALLLDEPLSALDEGTRDAMGDLIKDLNRSQGVTVLHVTHDRREAERLGDVLVRFGSGVGAASA